MTQLKRTALIDNLEADFITPVNRQYQFGDAISRFLLLPGLVGFWPTSSVNRSSGLCHDLSGQGRHLTFGGSGFYDQYNLLGHFSTNGATGYLTRADEVGLRIQGTETVYASGARGLTMGGWFRPLSTPGTSTLIMGKAINFNGPYLFWMSVGDNVTFRVRDSTDTTSYDVAITDGFLPQSAWHFVVGRYKPSTSIYIRVDDETNVNSTGIPAAIWTDVDGFAIGANSAGSQNWDGDACLCFLCANEIPTDDILSLYLMTKDLFNY